MAGGMTAVGTAAALTGAGTDDGPLVGSPSCQIAIIAWLNRTVCTCARCRNPEPYSYAEDAHVRGQQDSCDVAGESRRRGTRSAQKDQGAARGAKRTRREASRVL